MLKAHHCFRIAPRKPDNASFITWHTSCRDELFSRIASWLSEKLRRSGPWECAAASIAWKVLGPIPPAIHSDVLKVQPFFVPVSHPKKGRAISFRNLDFPRSNFRAGLYEAMAKIPSFPQGFFAELLDPADDMLGLNNRAPSMLSSAASSRGNHFSLDSFVGAYDPHDEADRAYLAAAVERTRVALAAQVHCCCKASVIVSLIFINNAVLVCF